MPNQLSNAGQGQNDILKTILRYKINKYYYMDTNM